MVRAARRPLVPAPAARAAQPADWAMHLASAEGADAAPQYETDRARFLGRGRTPADPAALAPGAALSNTTGPVLDPIFSLRRRLVLAPGASAVITFCTAVATSREQALQLADHYRDPQAVLRVFDLAWAHSQIELRHLRITTEDAHLYQRLAAYLLYAGPALRRRARCSPPIASGSRDCGGTASPAICPSCSSSVPRRRRRRSCASFSSPMPTGA